MTGEDIGVSETCYADDVKELNMASNAKNASEAIARSSKLLDEEIEDAGLRQNEDKAEHIAVFMGPGQEKETKELNKLLTDNAMGDLRKNARYLGAMLAFDVTPTETIRKIRAMAKEAFYSMGGVWKSRGSTLDTQALLQRASA